MFHPSSLLSTSTLIKLADDPAIRVRLHAALALGNRCRNEPAALEALGKIAAKDADDPWMRLAILSGLAESSLAFHSALRWHSIRDRPGGIAISGRRDRRRPPASRPSWSRCWN